jgi:phosphoribosylformylglycinamidine (FGAM) synthase PurS component
MEENYFSNYGQDESTAEEDETEADVTYKRGADHFLNGAVEKAEQFRQQAIYQGQLTSQDEDEFPDYKSLFGGEDTEDLQENEESLRSQLHTLVGNEMRLGKRVGMTGASNHAEEHKKAEKAVEDFLRMNPSMEEYRDEVEDHFTKLLFR